MAAPTIIKHGTRVTKNSGTGTLASSVTSVTIGHVIRCQISLNSAGTGGPISAPSGWNTAYSRALSGSGIYKPLVACFWKVATATTETCTITVPGTDADGYSQCTEMSSDATLDTSATTSADNGNSTATTATITAAATLASADSLVFVACTAEQGGGGTTSFSTPASSGYTSIGNNANDGTIIAYDQSEKTVAVTTAPSGTWTWSVASRYSAGIDVWYSSSGSGTNVATGVGAGTATGFAPTVAVTANQNVASGVGALAVTGFAPSVAVPRNALSGVGALVVAGFAATIAISANVNVASGVGASTLNGFASSVTATANVNIQSGAGVASISGFAPTVAATGNQNAATGVGQLTATAFAPAVSATANQNVTSALGLLGLTGFAPSVQAGAGAITGTGIAVVSGFAPTVTATANRNVQTMAGQTVATGFAPTAATPNAIGTGIGQLTAVGYAPVVSIGGAVRHLDEPLSIDFTSLATAIDFTALTTAIDFDSLETMLVFLDGGRTVFELTILQGEVATIQAVLRGADPETGELVPYDVSGASSLKINAGKTGVLVIEDEDLTKVDAANGLVSYTPTALETAVAGKYDALVVATFPGSPQIVRKFPGKFTIKDAIA